MKQLFGSLLLVFCIHASVSAWAGGEAQLSMQLDHTDVSSAIENSDRQAAQQLADQLASIKNLRAAFTQKVTDESGEIIDESSGWMAWQHPEQFRWEVQQPLQQSILIDGQQYYQYDRDLDQMLVQPLSDDISLLPRLLLSGSADEILRAFTVEKLEEIPQATVFSLGARQKDALFTAVHLQLGNEQLQAMTVIDELGQRSEFLFSVSDMLSGIVQGDDSLFQLEPAPGTDIIYQ